MDMEALATEHIHKETLNFTLLIYIRMKKPNPRHPNMRGDFGDIGDIFRKPSNHAVLPVFGFGDILGMSPRDGDFTRKIPLRVRRTGRFDAPKTGPRGRIRWEERPETPENDWLAHLRARYHCVCAAPVDSMRGTPTTKSGRSVGARNGWHPSR